MACFQKVRFFIQNLLSFFLWGFVLILSSFSRVHFAVVKFSHFLLSWLLGSLLSFFCYLRGEICQLLLDTQICQKSVVKFIVKFCKKALSSLLSSFERKKKSSSLLIHFVNFLWSFTTNFIVFEFVNFYFGVFVNFPPGFC